MDRINGANTVDIGGGRRGFRDRNLVAGLAGTQVTAAHMNAVQEEVLNVIETAGITPSDGDLGQLLAALSTLFGGDGSLVAADWWRLPNGLMVQWGEAGETVDLPAGSPVTISGTFPQLFPSACFVAVGAIFDSGVGGGVIESTNASTSGVAFAVREVAAGVQAIKIRYIALGH